MADRHVLAAVLAVLILATVPGLGADQPKELTVFCAAGLKDAFTEIGQIYENESGAGVVFNFDGVQVLRTQIENGAYADVLVSGSKKHTDALASEGYLNNSSISVFARNWQEVIVPRDNPGRVQNLSDLARPGVKIVMGTKDLPITEITMQILGKLATDPAYGPEYKERVLSNVISNETNINFIVSKVALGEADAAFVHKSEISPEYAEKVTVIEIPEKYNVRSDYSIGALKESKEPELAYGFINLVTSGRGRAVLEDH
ncbi:MAG TPA: molybdate ABC transporter substrate-binding protein, partial [Methanotrichaceae archaeon]|nr:molybdate ABC transporter substrate-binding protein [Methanotrichaceae archaeon]